MSRCTCPCPSPPGGQVTCEPGQLAKCIIRNGSVEASCTDPPDSIRKKMMQLKTTEAMLNNSFIANWILIEVTGDKRSDHQAISILDQNILRTGSYANPRLKITVKFRLIEP